jgi:diguanylate cyclase (GGDEF)-like protein
MKLRTRITLSMLATSLLALGLVGVVADQRLMSQFNQDFAQASTRNFRADVAAYIEKWGSWDAAITHEDFRNFAEHRRDREGRTAFTGMLNQSNSTASPPISTDETNITVDRHAVNYDRPDQPPRRPPPDAGDLDDEHRPPPQDINPDEAHGPQHLREQDRPGAVLQTRDGAVDIPYGLVRAPFRFTLFNTQGKALMAIAPYKVGDIVREADRKGAIPIEVNGQIHAYLLPKAGVNFSDLDLGYIRAMRESLMIGLGTAALLALGLGILLGNYLSSNLQRLTKAIRHLQTGALGKQIEIKSKDEVGELAQAFNHMSEELARSHAELKASNKKIAEQADILRELSLRDALTHLHNRRHFDEQAGKLFIHAKRSARPLTIMMGDIDHFKQINDKFSHAIGDKVLRTVGEILRAQTRTTDLVARYGGEEFVIAFVDTPLEHAHQLCDKLRAHIAAHDWSEIHPQLTVTISIGVAQLERDHNLDQVMQNADEQLYRAKASGRNQVCKAA